MNWGARPAWPGLGHRPRPARSARAPACALPASRPLPRSGDAALTASRPILPRLPNLSSLASLSLQGMDPISRRHVWDIIGTHAAPLPALSSAHLGPCLLAAHSIQPSSQPATHTQSPTHPHPPAHTTRHACFPPSHPAHPPTRGAEASKPGRAIVLTTHSMEEADILGDRIGIMARGTLRALGPSLRLKQRFGSGYQLSVSCAPVRTGALPRAQLAERVAAVAAFFKASRAVMCFATLRSSSPYHAMLCCAVPALLRALQRCAPTPARPALCAPYRRTWAWSLPTRRWPTRSFSCPGPGSRSCPPSCASWTRRAASWVSRTCRSGWPRWRRYSFPSQER